MITAFKLNYQTDVVYTDFAKALNKIDHGILAKKLYQSGLCNPFFSWLVSFLSSRKQYIKFKNYNSYMCYLWGSSELASGSSSFQYLY